MRALGGTVERTHAEGGILTANVIDRIIARAMELIDEPGTFWPDQVTNPDNVCGYHPMGHEILRDLGDGIDEFVMAVGEGGCISGNSEILKDSIPPSAFWLSSPITYVTSREAILLGSIVWRGLDYHLCPPYYGEILSTM